MTRTLLMALAAYHALNGATMLMAPDFWYATVPGVDHTGPANTHFIRDIGLGFLAAATALLLAARGATPLLAPALVFLVGHAGLHLFEMAAHGTTVAGALRDTVLIVLPAVLPLAALRSGGILGRGTA